MRKAQTKGQGQELTATKLVLYRRNKRRQWVGKRPSSNTYQPTIQRTATNGRLLAESGRLPAYTHILNNGLVFVSGTTSVSDRLARLIATYSLHFEYSLDENWARLQAMTMT